MTVGVLCSESFSKSLFTTRRGVHLETRRPFVSFFGKGTGATANRKGEGQRHFNPRAGCQYLGRTKSSPGNNTRKNETSPSCQRGPTRQAKTVKLKRNPVHFSFIGKWIRCAKTIRPQDPPIQSAAQRRKQTPLGRHEIKLPGHLSKLKARRPSSQPAPNEDWSPQKPLPSQTPFPRCQPNVRLPVLSLLPRTKTTAGLRF